jgi:hypothetical protein
MASAATPDGSGQVVHGADSMSTMGTMKPVIAVIRSNEMIRRRKLGMPGGFSGIGSKNAGAARR